MSSLLWLCFCLSGAAALALEMLWMRSAGLVLGTTVLTTVTILACYFAGLGLGAAGARQVSSQPVRLYGRLELGAGVGALWSLAIFWLLTHDTAQGWLATLGIAGRVAAVALAILPTTLCLGATLPALGQALTNVEAVGRHGGLLYAINTLGGVFGAAAAGFGLPALVGVRASYGIAAGTSLLAGILAILIGDRHEKTDATELRREKPIRIDIPKSNFRHPPFTLRLRRWRGYAQGERENSTTLEPPIVRAERSESEVEARACQLSPELQLGMSSSARRRRLRLVAAGTGALGLGLEVLWTRLFAQVLHNSVYSFTAVALVFLLAIAMGAALAAFLLRRATPATVAATALVTAASGTIGGLWLFVYWTNGLAYMGMRAGLVEYLLRIMVLAIVTVGPTAVASGVVLPALWAAWGDRTSAAQPLGDLSAANLFGGVFGAVATGFLIIPTLGVRGSLLVMAVVYVLLADLLAAPQGRFRPLAYAVLIAIVVVNPLRAPLVHLRPEGETLHNMVEGANGVVTVVEADGDLQLRLDNYYILGGSAAATNERRQGLLPLLLHPNPRHIAFIGLATGISASAGPALSVEETTVIELVPEVAALARTYFAPWNARLLDRSDVRLVLDDGRRSLAASRERFDVIVSDLFIPWHAGTGNLYAREMYDTVARRLAADGLFCQWLPLYQLTREEFDIIVHTFLAVFPQVSLWRDDFYPDRPVVGLVGQLTPWSLDLTRIRERLLHLPDWSRDPLLSSTRGLIMLYAGNLTAAADLFTSAPFNTDDRPLIEFLAPRLTRITTAGDKDWFTGEALAAFYDTLETRLADIPNPLLPESDETTAARRAGTALYHYALAAARHDDVSAARLQTEVRELVPEVILAAEAGSPKPSLAEAQQDLAGLRREQEGVRRRLEDMERRLRELSGSEENAQ